MVTRNRDEQLILLLGDIHANEVAFMATLEDARRRYPGRRLPIWFLGDLFGRGPRPTATWRRFVQNKPEAVVIGNHEGGLIDVYTNITSGDSSTGQYNPPDWEVLLRHREDLHSVDLLTCEGGHVVGGAVFDTVSHWPVVFMPRPSIYMVHGGLERAFEPGPDLQHRLVWEYVKNSAQADHTLEAMNWLAANPPDDPAFQLWPDGPAKPELVLVGHWHTRLFYDQTSGEWQNPVQLDTPYSLDGQITLLSPGSVGFPRQNGELNASYCVLTLRNNRPFQAVFHTSAYDRESVRNEMVRQGYPTKTVGRLRLPGETETARPGVRVAYQGCVPEDES